MLVSLLAGLPGTVRAQEPVEPADAARFRLGALRFTPSIALTNLGVDQNVFNEAQDPKSDTTAAFGPDVQLWMRVGKGRLSGRTSGQYLYFKTYENQRGWNTSNEARLDVPLARLTPFAAGSYVNSRERPGFEIDSRARRTDRTGQLGSAFRASSKTTLILAGAVARTAYDREETFLGASLAEVLDRTSTTEQIELRHSLTPLTTLVVTTEGIQDRFVTAIDRDADSVRVLPGFEFKPFALISGRVKVGFRRLNMLDPQTPDFNGLAASVDVKYAIKATRIGLRFNRDLVFSFDPSNPYYALSDVNIEVLQRITHTWDVVARAGRQTLAYRSNISTDDVSKVDRAGEYGAGFGYRVGEIVRLGLDANYYRRDSDTVSFRSYDGLRIGAAITYGLPQ